MNKQPRLLSAAELNAVQGAGWGWLFVMIGAAGSALEIIHVIELFNYGADRWYNGCNNIDDKDYFARMLCGCLPE